MVFALPDGNPSQGVTVGVRRFLRIARTFLRPLASIERWTRPPVKQAGKPEYEKHFRVHLQLAQGKFLARLFKADKRSP
ncbi:protein of unknown function [Pseudomonas sp. JV551A1]|uniref:Uncharacterized protein n=1 Tax=Pseudomonas inefficax TaxID=2078786 RepID=A0AAQ1PF55_9PSED|nr:protein of unknown function [Pseudomonas sp. JV551A1]SPO63403.1 protein of unknown function [Pseudomonas inefficax]